MEIQATAQHYIDHSISSCIVADTLIETNKGLFYFDEIIDISTLDEGTFKKNTDTELLVKNKDGKFVPIDLFYNNGCKPIMKLTLDNGLSLTATGNEKVLVFDEYNSDENWKKIEDLDMYDLVKISVEGV